MSGPIRPEYETGLERPVNPENPAVVASPVDTYVRPALDPLFQLTESLKGFSAGVGELGQVLQRQKVETDTTEGTQKGQEALVAGAKSWKDAIAKGLVDPSRSPYYQAAIQELFGQNAGSALMRDWTTAAASNPTFQLPVDNATVDAAFTKFATEWTKTNVDTYSGDQHFQNGFSAVVAKGRQQTLNTAAESLAERMSKSAGAGLFTLIMQYGQDTNNAGGRPDVEFPAAIQAAANIQYNANPKNGTLIAQKTAEAIAAYAVKTGDSSWLKAMDHVQLGSGVLSDTEYGQKVYQSALKEIIEKRSSAAHLDDLLQTEKHKAAVETTIKGFTDALTTAGDKAGLVDTTSVIRDLEAQNEHGLAAAVPAIQQNWVNKGNKDDPETRDDLFGRIWYHNADIPQPTRADLYTALGHGTITASTFRELNHDLDQQESGQGTPFSKDAILNEYRTSTKGMYASEYGNTAQALLNANSAVNDVTNAYMTWRLGAGKGASEQAAHAFMQKEQARVFTLLSRSHLVSTQAKLPDITGPGQVAPPNPDKVPVTTSSNINRVEQELWEVQNHRRTFFSAGTQSILKAAGVGSKPEEIRKFLDAQRSVSKDIPPFVPDTTTH